MPKVPCYLSTRRREWSLSQEDLASLVPGGYRVRVSNVERGIILPKASELFAYAFIFGCPPTSLFPAYADEIQDAVMAAAYRLSQQLEGANSPKARRKAELLEDMLGRVTSHIPNL